MLLSPLALAGLRTLPPLFYSLVLPVQVGAQQIHAPRVVLRDAVGAAASLSIPSGNTATSGRRHLASALRDNCICSDPPLLKSRNVALRLLILLPQPAFAARSCRLLWIEISLLLVSAAR